MDERMKGKKEKSRKRERMELRLETTSNFTQKYRSLCSGDDSLQLLSIFPIKICAKNRVIKETIMAVHSISSVLTSSSV